MEIIDDLRANLRYDAYTGAFFWRFTRNRLALAGQEAGTVDARGYIAISFRGKTYKAHRLAWLFTYGEWPTRDLDHVNREKADNRIVNLRECSSSQNQANRCPNKNNSSGFRGVTFHRNLGKYQAAIRVNYKLVHLGTFSSVEDAGQAYGLAAINYFGSFSALLVPGAKIREDA